MKMQEVITVNQLSKSYNGKVVLENLSFSLDKGRVLGLIGANGAGKSTSIECILGTKKKDGGKVRILGKNPMQHRKTLFQKVGVQFQESSYPNEIKVHELCSEMACLYKKTADWKALLKQFGLQDKEKALVKNLSGGEKQRLFIILALIPKPEVVFLDELTTGLDPKARREVWAILKKLKQNGMTMILTSHFMEEIEALCDEIIILRKGQMVFKGNVEEAIKQSGMAQFEAAYLWYAEEEENENFC